LTYSTKLTFNVIARFIIAIVTLVVRLISRSHSGVAFASVYDSEFNAEVAGGAAEGAFVLVGDGVVGTDGFVKG
jgi:hypothetical protein